MTRHLFAGMPILLIGLLWFLAAAPVRAERSYGLSVPRMVATQTAPVVDGARGRNEYAGAWRSSRILYRPMLDAAPASVELLATDSMLFIFVEGLPLRQGREAPFVSLTFDPENEGGRMPDADDLEFTLTEDGMAQAGRGAGQNGFVLDPSITGWSSALNRGQSSWSAEFGIPLSLLGGNNRAGNMGFRVGHHAVIAAVDEFVWPPKASRTQPTLWGGLLLIPLNKDVDVDVARITQGLEKDISAGVYYEKIAGKDTLVRVQLYSPGLFPPKVMDAICYGELVFPPFFTNKFDLKGTGVPTAELSNVPYGSFNGSPVINFWIPGKELAPAGVYEFRLRVRLQGSSTYRELKLGTKTFWPSGDVRLLMAPWENTKLTAADFRNWGNDLWDAIPQSMLEFSRMFPVRSGIAYMQTTPGAPPAAAGVRYLIACLKACNPTDADAGACDTHGRHNANQVLHAYNINAALTGVLDRLDRAVLLVAVKATGGGQAQFGWSPCSSGAGFDADWYGASASVINQEVAHCFGEVNDASPNADGGWHSINVNIPLAKGLPMVNMMNRKDYTNPRSVLYGFVTNAPESFMEGYEWNSLRKTFLSKPAFPLAPKRAQVGPLFRFAGEIDLFDVVTVRYSQRLDDESLPLTPPAASSPYRLEFRTQRGGPVLATHLFEVRPEGTHDGLVEKMGIQLVTPLPAGVGRYEIRKDTAFLFGEDFTSAAPVVSNVLVIPVDEGFDLEWTADDPDSPNLRFNIYYLPAVQSERIPLAIGLVEPLFRFDTSIIPATPGGVLIVEATDGLNTGQAMSAPFMIPDRPPFVRIDEPTSVTEIIAGQPFTLVGSALDASSGPLSGNALAWTSDRDGALGFGEQLETRLSSGTHLLMLTATAPSGQSAPRRILVDVVEDTDGDGLPDSYENQHGCLSAQRNDSAEDPDGDGLSSLAERLFGTNPCDPDSDVDGIGDGDEVRLGGEPRNAQLLPAPDRLFLTADWIDLGICDGRSSRTLALETAAPDVLWSATDDAEWLDVTPEGMGDGSVRLLVDCRGLPGGQYTAQMMVTSPGSQPRFVDVIVTVRDATRALPLWKRYR